MAGRTQNIYLAIKFTKNIRKHDEELYWDIL